MAKKHTEGQLAFNGEAVVPAPMPPNPNDLYDEVRTSLGSRKGSKREAYSRMQKQLAQTKKQPAQQAAPAQTVQPADPVEPRQKQPAEKRSLAERLLIMKEQYGFIPMSRGEATMSLRLLDDIGTPFSTARYLHTVNMRQAKPDVDIIDSRRTPSALIREMGNYAANARFTRMMVQDVAGRLDGVRHSLTLLDVMKSPGTDQPVTLDMLTPFYRHHKVRNAISASHLDRNVYEDMEEGVLDFDYFTAPIEGDYEEGLLAFAGTMTVMGIRSNAEDLDLQHTYRGTFWNERVNEARNFLPGRTAVAMVRGRTPAVHYVEPPIDFSQPQVMNG